jgi:hypothetical protein
MQPGTEERGGTKVRVILYRSGNEAADKAVRQALKSNSFQVQETNCPDAVRNGGPAPVAHFCGKGVAFGEKGIVEFARKVQKSEAQQP